MPEGRLQRRLAAILAADVVGYSRMMAADEAATHGRLKSHRAAVFDPVTQRFGGRIFKTTGDGALARRNEGIGDDQRIILRIGISLGDVIVDDDDLYGNGVNVAARMEGLAEPSGIYISGNVHEHVGLSPDFEFVDLGAQSVKNVAEPIRCYRLVLEPDPESATVTAAPAPRPDLAIDKPSIAVLPFDNMSGEAEQEYFSDGITEDIITALSRIRQLSVLARNTSFTYKGRSVDVPTVARDLSVRYVLEGSVRKAGNRVRITA